MPACSTPDLSLLVRNEGDERLWKDVYVVCIACAWLINAINFCAIVLDEATSAMDNASEIEMFNQCRLLNITCITVCHNVGLTRFHQRRIELDGNDGRWSSSDIPKLSDVESHDDYDDGGPGEQDEF